MFDEEEWADEPSTNEPVTTVNLPPVASKQGKVVGKKSLLKTLQTLGSVPTWDNDRTAENSGDEDNVSSAVKATKKKRSKKRKRTINKEDGKDVKQQNVPEVPEKKSRQMTLKENAHQKSEKTGSDENGKANGDQMEKEGKTEDKLNRKQWKNRMKNKRRCKNKYLEKTKDADVVNAKLQSIKQQEVTKNTDLPSKKNSKTSKKPHSTNKDLPEMHEIPKNSISEDTESQSKKTAKKVKTNNAAREDHKETASKAITLTTSAEALSLDRSSTLREKMVKRLEAARFRFINEQLYTSSSGEAKRMFQQDPEAIGVYHRGYTAQVQHWPSNPLDSIITYICQKSPSLVVADFGCGDCKIARTVKNKVHSFDLAPVCDLATACDMAKVPLQDSSVDIVVFCLSLMGTNLRDFLAEANRVLVMSGVVKIAEVASRFEDVRSFIGAVSSLGFKLVNKDIGNSHFYSFEFIKTGKAPENAKKSAFQLKPCLYKKR